MAWHATPLDVHHLTDPPEGRAYFAEGYGDPSGPDYLVVAAALDLWSDSPYTGKRERHWRGPAALREAKAWLEQLAREDERDERRED